MPLICNIRCCLLLPLFLAIGLGNSKAQEFIEDEYNNVHEVDSARAPHGGILKIADSFFVEFVSNNSKPSFYIYDLDVKPISNKNYKGKATFYFLNKTALSVSLMKQGLNGFSTGNRNLNGYASCEVVIVHNGKVSRIAFVKPEVKSIKYTCSLHPEIVRDEPGNCPRCGMLMVEKKEMARKNARPKDE